MIGEKNVKSGFNEHVEKHGLGLSVKHGIELGLESFLGSTLHTNVQDGYHHSFLLVLIHIDLCECALAI